MKPVASIIISSYNRVALLRRTLWSIAMRPPACSFEVVLADEGSTEDVLGELKRYSSKFAWKFVRVNHEEFTAKTGIARFHNNPSVTNNIAAMVSDGSLLFQQGNEVIAWDDLYARLISEAPQDTPNFMVMSTTYDVPRDILDLLDSYGSNLLPAYVEHCKQWPLQSRDYRSDVTNYVTLVSRALWEKLRGYNEQYFGGISSEDSDFVRRARALKDFRQVISDGISLHQSHNGKTRYYDPSPSVITKARWDEGVEKNHAIYGDWDGTHENPQPWPMAAYGAGEVITNTR